MKINYIGIILMIVLLSSCWGSSGSNSSTYHTANKEVHSRHKEKYTCEYCGKEFGNIQDMAINSCKKHPDGIYEGSHKLYEGSTKSRYECKYCGKTAKSIYDLVSSKCKHSPNDGWHRPRL